MGEKLVLALDGATSVCCAALLAKGRDREEGEERVVARRAERSGRGQARILLRQVDEMLDEVGAEPGDVAKIVVGVGPGTFTGVRVAVATARGLALGLGVPVYGSGTNIPAETAHLCGASIAVHGTGKNLQAWSNQLVISPPSSGKAWEQLLGRMHRTGQQADEVHCTVYNHTTFFDKALENAKRDAEYIHATQGQKQRVAYATWT